MTKLDKLGKGIILMHDFQKHTADALPTLLRRLKEGGYKVVQIKAKTQLATLPEYDAALAKDMKLPAARARARSPAWCRRFRSRPANASRRDDSPKRWPGLTRPSTSFFVGAA